MSNQPTKEQLKLLYGCRCMLTGIQTQNLTYHHILKKEYGGKQTTDNGALLIGAIHKWIHEQEDNETFWLIMECLILYKKCLDENRKDLIKLYEEEVMPLMKGEIKNDKCKNKRTRR